MRGLWAPFSFMALVAVSLNACAYVPEPVAGVPTDDGWVGFPLRRSLQEGRIQPQAMTACLAGDCPARIAVGVFLARDEEATILEGFLREPARLARALEAAPSRSPGRSGGVAVAARPLTEGERLGFVITIARAEGPARAAHGAAFGRRRPEGLQLVLVVGDDAAAVEATARRVAREHLR